MATTIKQSLTAVGTTNVAAVLACDFVVSGTFAGTWKFEALINDEWLTIERGTTSGAYLRVAFALLRQVRFSVETFTSGTFSFSLDGRDFG
ncbi:hypothetical protein ASG43_03395 [Aureimonas sp. Leaf454]|uniref:hypothetical protein n=1 Tax=Aureimonas sp. Leaf454 TaxID=1736381 RepID=UPI0006F60B43|nr:hypothetical protein [Aureimonas sp. Leaf454]KQT54645.1 hypothetical protein ASG43_03395 [Aureimonas sp. Leaf454]